MVSFQNVNLPDIEDTADIVPAKWRTFDVIAPDMDETAEIVPAKGVDEEPISA